MTENKKIEILVFPRSNFGEQDVEILKEIGEEEGFEVNVDNSACPFWLSYKFLKILLSPSRIFEYYKRLKRVDIFFAWWATSFDIVLLAKIIKKPCIIVAGGGEVENLRKMPKEYKSYSNSSFIRRLKIKFALKFADKIISVSNYTKENVDRITNSKNKNHEVVHNGIDIDFFKPMKIKKKSYILTVLWMSKLRMDIKGVLPLLEAFSKVILRYPEYYLVYLGNEFEKIGAGEIIKSKAKELGILDKIIIMDFPKDRKTYAKFLNQCKIYIQYSWNEMSPVSIREAMACGVPVIGSDIPGIREVVGNAGLLADRGDMIKGNPEDLAKKIELLLSDNNLYNRLSRLGIKRVRKYFSKTIRKERLRIIINNLLKTKNKD